MGDMKRLLVALPVTAMLLVMLITAIPSCSKQIKNPNDETSGGNMTDTNNTVDSSYIETSAIKVGESVSLKSGNSQIQLIGEENNLKITQLTTKTGRNTVTDPVTYSFPALISANGNSSLVAKWQFKEAIKLSYHGKTEVIYTYSEPTVQSELNIRVRAHNDIQGPFEFITELVNKSEGDYHITPKKFAAVSFNVGKNAYAWLIKKESGVAEGMTDHNGRYYSGQGIYIMDTEQQKEGNAWVNTNQDWNRSGYLPMIYLQGDDVGVYCALEWSSGRVLWNRNGNNVVLSVDMDAIAFELSNIYDFGTKVKSGSTFVFPTVYYGAYEGDVDEGSNEFKKWFFTLKVPSNLRDNKNEPLTQMGIAAGPDVSVVGCESIKWEYGWWSNDRLSKTEDWRSLEGAWATAEVRHVKYQQLMSGAGVTSLRGFGALCKMFKQNFTIYLLLHDTLDETGKPTDAYSEFNSVTHPDWFSNRKVTTGMGNSADLGNEECVEYLKTALVKFFSENYIGTWRTDFEPISRSSNLKNRHYANGSDVMYWCTVGFRDIVTHLIENVPGFRYESCSSGGSMKDLFTATIATVINCDDSANYLSLRTTFYDSSYVIHPTQLQLPMNSNFFDTNHSTFYPDVKSTCNDADYDFRETMLDMGFRSCIVGPPMMGSWTGVVLYDKLNEYAKMYREKIRPIQREGELYHILPRPDGKNWDGIMYADPDSINEIKGVVFLFKPSEETTDTYKVVMRGLSPDVTYQLTFEDRTEQNCIVKGSDLMTKGIDVYIKSIGSEIIWITEAK